MKEVRVGECIASPKDKCRMRGSSTLGRDLPKEPRSDSSPK